MKITVHIIRTLLALLFLWASLAYFFQLMDAPPQTGNMKVFNEGLMASGYLFTLLKSVELLCGIFLLINLYAPLANVVLFPVSVNIFCVHAFMDPKGLPIAVAVIVFQLFLAYAYRKNYAALFTIKPL